MIISGIDAKGNELIDEGSNATIWIDLTTSTTNPPAVEVPDNPFYVKPENTFAIANYMEIMVTCPHYDDEGGFDMHCINLFESHGRNIDDFAYWSDLLEFAYTYANDEFYNHQHGNLFAYTYSYTDGMTWGDFISSAENNGTFALDKDGNIYYAKTGFNYGYLVANNNSYLIQPTDTIDSDIFYFISFANANID